MADFTEVYKQSFGLCHLSPNEELIATAVQHRLVIRDSQSLQILQLYDCSEAISHVSWSSCSELVMIASFKLGIIQIFSMKDELWSCKIDEGVLGTKKLLWCPDGRHLLSFSDFDLRITIWSLCSKEALFIQSPKYHDRGYHFRNDGKYFALAERIESLDHVSVFDCSDWTLIKRFPVETVDLYDLAWSPDGRYIAVWDSITNYKVVVYRPDGRLVNAYTAYDTGLGIKSVAWSPSSQFLAIGSFDEKIRLLNHYTWTPLITFDHPKKKHYCEVDVSEIKMIGQGVKSWSGNKPKLQYEVNDTPSTIATLRSDVEKPNPKRGVGILGFNSTGSMIVSRNDSQLASLWIHDISTAKLITIITQTSNIKAVKWNPVLEDQLAFCCGNGLIYLWEFKYGCDAIEVPVTDFLVHDFRWSSDGKKMILLDKEKFCLTFLLDE